MKVSMTEEQYITALTNNPHGIRNIPNPTEAMQLTCVAQNGMLLQYIKEPTEKVLKRRFHKHHEPYSS